MPDYYMLTRASITMDYITAHRARELYANAQAEPETGLHGDLDTGFYFWAFDMESGLKLIHYRVIPVPTDEVPEDVRDRLHHRPDTPPDAAVNTPT
jgi:hypothetical protein